MHKHVEGRKTKIKLMGAGLVSCVVSIHPFQGPPASILFVDELHRGIQVQCHPGGLYDHWARAL